MGGSLALWSGALADEIKVAVGFYPAHAVGADVADVGQLRQQVGDDPRLRGGRHVAGRRRPDRGRAASRVPAATVEVYDYPGSHHAFFNDERPEAHDAEHSATAWRRTVDLLGSDSDRVPVTAPHTEWRQAPEPIGMPKSPSAWPGDHQPGHAGTAGRTTSRRPPPRWRTPTTYAAWPLRRRLAALDAAVSVCRACPRLVAVARGGRGRQARGPSPTSPTGAGRSPGWGDDGAGGPRRRARAGRARRQPHRADLHRRPQRRLAVRRAAPRRPGDPADQRRTPATGSGCSAPGWSPPCAAPRRPTRRRRRSATPARPGWTRELALVCRQPAGGRGAGRLRLAGACSPRCSRAGHARAAAAAEVRPRRGGRGRRRCSCSGPSTRASRTPSPAGSPSRCSTRSSTRAVGRADCGPRSPTLMSMAARTHPHPDRRRRLRRHVHRAAPAEKLRRELRAKTGRDRRGRPAVVHDLPAVPPRGGGRQPRAAARRRAAAPGARRVRGPHRPRRVGRPRAPRRADRSRSAASPTT